MNSDSTIAVLAILFLFYLISASSEIEDTTVYFAHCSDFKHNTFSCPQDQYLMVSKTSYKVFLKEQMVISSELSKMNNCTVIDKENWICREGDYTQSIKDGDYWDVNSGSLDEKDQHSILPLFQQIPSSAYYIRLVRNFFREL